VVLSGPNGSGKTNLLEAISLLVPGRGLRGARLAELAQAGSSDGGAIDWAVAGRLATPQGVVEIGTGTAGDSATRRIFRLDGAAPRSQAAVAERVAAVWLTPQMDRLFAEGASGRRRFLDRLVLPLQPGHAGEVAALETAAAGRGRLLALPRADPAWVAGVEHALARHAVSVTAARLALVARLNAALAAGAADPFPRARLALLGGVAERLASMPALAVEEGLRAELAAHREGPPDSLRADLRMRDEASGAAAEAASTGQQKALLLGVVLGHAALLAEARGAAPLLLLDEPAVHLDRARREALFACLTRLPAQAFLTGTDHDVFAPLRGRAGFWRVTDGNLQAD
jgi:DNA replication and repair protein RecF